MSQTSEKSQLIVKCIDFYVNSLTENESKCPSVDEMREIVKLDDIKTSLSQSKKADDNSS